MSDFIYSNKIIEKGQLTKEFNRVFHFDHLDVYEFHGDWGSLAVTRNHYNGFLPYENDDHIAIVIGGPILYFRDNKFLNNNNSYEGTKSIYFRWREGKIVWDEDLSGPFAVLIINKKTCVVDLITDMMSFIPVFMYQDTKNTTLLSSHVDILANLSGQNDKIDLISCADFILHGAITFPYTTYKDIKQVYPASIYRLSFKDHVLESHSYWLPKEEYKYKSIQEAANEIIKGLRRYIYAITSEVTNIAQFISGGEDSRLLSALLKEYPRDAIIFLDHMNREGIIAKKAANAYNANFKLATRSKSHYLRILPECSDLVGSGSQYHHAHTFGFHKSCKLDEYSAVFGGLLSDALLKGSHIRRKLGKLSFLIEIKDEKNSIVNSAFSKLITEDALNELKLRRQKHLNHIKSFRASSAEEWFELWPSSMNKNIPNIHANRRLFKSYEPFMTNDLIKISASVPQEWKLNRRLFHRAAKPFLKPTKWLSHSNGRLPYFPWYVNSVLQLSIKVIRKIGHTIGITKGHQGPWAEWNAVVKSNEWDKAISEYSSGFKNISSIFSEEDVGKILRDSNLDHFEKVNLMQLLYHIKKNST